MFKEIKNITPFNSENGKYIITDSSFVEEITTNKDSWKELIISVISLYENKSLKVPYNLSMLLNKYLIYHRDDKITKVNELFLDMPEECKKYLSCIIRQMRK